MLISVQLNSAASSKDTLNVSELIPNDGVTLFNLYRYRYCTPSLLYLKVEFGQPEFLFLRRLFVLLALVSHILLAVYVRSVAVYLLVICLKKENSKITKSWNSRSWEHREHMIKNLEIRKV
jgi:hypothetical protein